MKQELNDKIFEASLLTIMTGALMCFLGVPIAGYTVDREFAAYLLITSIGAIGAGLAGGGFAAWTNPARLRN